MPELCEVRVITYRRPQWLRQALLSLVGQTHRDWVALLFDDSPDREGEKVVRELNDPRIDYRPNPRNLGCTANTNKAFRSGPYAGGTYACLLEDDNWLLPGWLAENIAAVRSTGCRIVHRNQEVWDRRTDPPAPTGRTTLGRWFVPGVMSPTHLHAYSFFFPGVSHGALFWRTDCASNLQVDEGIEDASLQEYARCLQITEPSVYRPEPQAAYADVPGELARKPRYAGRRFGRFLQHLHRGLRDRDGPAVLREAEAIADRLGLRAELEKSCYNSLIFGVPRKALGRRAAAAAALRGAVKYATTENICPTYQPPRPG